MVSRLKTIFTLNIDNMYIIHRLSNILNIFKRNLKKDCINCTRIINIDFIMEIKFSITNNYMGNLI